MDTEVHPSDIMSLEDLVITSDHNIVLDSNDEGKMRIKDQQGEEYKV